ncbi:IS5/IS1182 family transposase [Candidatus Poribacteria bacterium]|nr:MAG: IS5/IS1182 family transposase [Candidatus Poribacteria bacterium]
MTQTNYPTDLTDAQWCRLLPYLPKPSPVGRPLKWKMRAIINAIFYIVKSGCQWRMLPHQMPPWQTVYSHFRKWKTDGTWLMIHQALHEQIRCDIGKAPSPTVAIIDSQSVKTTELADTRGFDAHKKVKGRKRHIVTDTIGIPLRVKVTDANISDNRVAIELLTEIFRWHITIQLVCADAGYRGKLGDWLYMAHQCQLDIAPSLRQSGFVVVPLRWIVERTFSWFGRFRRLTLDYERSAETAEAMVYIASIYLMQNRIK